MPDATRRLASSWRPMHGFSRVIPAYVCSHGRGSLRPPLGDEAAAAFHGRRYVDLQIFADILFLHPAALSVLPVLGLVASPVHHPGVIRGVVSREWRALGLGTVTGCTR